MLHNSKCLSALHDLLITFENVWSVLSQQKKTFFERDSTHI